MVALFTVKLPVSWSFNIFEFIKKHTFFKYSASEVAVHRSRLFCLSHPFFDRSMFVDDVGQKPLMRPVHEVNNQIKQKLPSTDLTFKALIMTATDKFWNIAL